MRIIIFFLVVVMTLMIGGSIVSNRSKKAQTYAVPVKAKPEPAPRHPAEPGRWMLSENGLGPVRIDEKPEQIGAELGEPFLPTGKDAIPCVNADWPSQPEGVTVSMDGGKVTHITIAVESKVRSDLGIGIGDDAEELVRRAQGAGREVRNEGRYLLVLPTSPSSPPKALAFWINDGKVFMIRAAFENNIEREPCR